ncbi:hypothetical protein BC1002_6511 [Paraburkholderia atlantica]|uniref:Uncharacterized protein n=1 Tax=Paraburkholderia atlantica TaxID=2654982 RepID=D5WMA7_PARAM|nr:hypothetical protein [Paraburkholderia atlantica]ADG20353.1 hypothetical protein BC1002_6511 [Paraburkholderia atlantica]
MPCTPFKLPGGGSGFICTRGRRTRCAAGPCASSSSYQCDYPVGPRKTCDRHLCAKHAHEIAPDVHYCPEHCSLWKRAGAPMQSSFDFDQENQES